MRFEMGRCSKAAHCWIARAACWLAGVTWNLMLAIVLGLKFAEGVQRPRKLAQVGQEIGKA